MPAAHPARAQNENGDPQLAEPVRALEGRGWHKIGLPRADGMNATRSALWGKRTAGKNNGGGGGSRTPVPDSVASRDYMLSPQ